MYAQGALQLGSERRRATKDDGGLAGTGVKQS
jgi:hypothetical protein